jgi:hypothetical protein
MRTGSALSSAASVTTAPVLAAGGHEKRLFREFCGRWLSVAPGGSHRLA